MHFLSKGSLLAVGVMAVAAAFMLVMASFSTPQKSEAATTAVEGVYDILVDSTGTFTGSGLYHCIGYVSVVGGPATSTKFVCYTDTTALGDANGEPINSAPGEGEDGLEGAPPPPPYTTYEPQTGSGDATGSTNKTCFANLGGTSGPNLISSVTVAGGLTTGTSTGVLALAGNQSDTACSTLTPVGLAGALPTQFYKITSKTGTVEPGCAASWRSNAPAHSCTDYDGDGCTDKVELLGTSPTTCGDDPYNPYDSNAADLRGTYSLAVEVTAPLPDADCAGLSPCPANDAGASAFNESSTFHCISVVTTASGSASKAYCYIDSSLTDVNGAGYLGCKGDGNIGAAPPGDVRNDWEPDPDCGAVWADMDDKHTALTGTVSSGNVTFKGCFEAGPDPGALGNVYTEATFDATGGLGIGSVTIWATQTLANCQAGTPTGSTLTADIRAARQNGGVTTVANVGGNDADYRDTDADGCSDAEELGDDEQLGGLRDPYNRGDWFDPSGDGTVSLFDDILAISFKFGTSGDPNTKTLGAGANDYDSKYDRGDGIIGSNVWNITPGNGTIGLFDDIFGAAFQFGHSC